MTYGQALDMPDGPGWWAFEGRRDAVTDEHLQLPCEVFAYDDGELLARLGHLGSYRIKWLIGKWTRLCVPWEAQ